VIEAREPEPFLYDREHVVMLTDWTDEDPARVFRKLKKESDYYNFRQRTFADLVRDVRVNGLGATLAERGAWGRMRMSAADLADVTGTTYTYLMNGRAPAGNWTGLFRSGERVRLRFINGSAMSYFDVRIPGLTMTVVAADGQHVQPVEVDEFRIAVAETYDVIVRPAAGEAFTIFAQAMDRTGFAAGTLAVRDGLAAPVPSIDPRPTLTMADMGHGGTGHDMTATATGVQATAPAPSPADAAADPHAAHRPAAPAPAALPEGHASPQPADPHAGHTAMTGASTQTHPASEHGNPLVDMQTMTPSAKLSDPGIGLRGNGRRVLTYADLRSVFPDPDGREPRRTIELHLTGHMARFAWSFDGVRFSDAEPIRLTYGERVRLVLVNDTMMTHPIHLHGMWSDLEDEQGRFLVRKHTIDMPPGSRRSYRVTADALGRWAFHCHLLYHMEAGMFREVRVDE
jgi:CopA family copper-resistance protein